MLKKIEISEKDGKLLVVLMMDNDKCVPFTIDGTLEKIYDSDLRRILKCVMRKTNEKI